MRQLESWPGTMLHQCPHLFGLVREMNSKEMSKHLFCCNNKERKRWVQRLQKCTWNMKCEDRFRGQYNCTLN